MTATNGQTGTAESTGTVQVAPPPFHVPAGSACVEDCDDAPLGWSSPAVGAANLPAEAQGGGGDMIGCWQVARSTDPNGDSATSAEEEIMQLYVSADGAGGNEGLWFRVRDDGSFSSWTSLRSPQATTTDVKNASNVDKYVPPDLLQHAPGVAAAWGKVHRDATVLSSHNVSNVTVSRARYTVSLSITMANADYVVITNPQSREAHRLQASGVVTQTTTSFTVDTQEWNATASDQPREFHFVVFGELA